MPWSKAWGFDCAAKGTGRISKGLRFLVEERAGVEFGLQPRRRHGQAGLSMSELGAEYDKLKVRVHAQVWRRFKWRTGELPSCSSYHMR